MDYRTLGIRGRIVSNIKYVPFPVQLICSNRRRFRNNPPPKSNDHLGNFGHVCFQSGLDDQCREGALRADTAVDLRLNADQYVTTTSGLGSNHFIFTGLGERGVPISSATNLWEQSLLAIGAGQSTTGLAGLPLSRASFAPTDFAPAELLADRQWIGWAFL